MPTDCKIFVGGGFDDNVTHIVENYAARYQNANPAAQVHYHSWKRDNTIRGIIDGLGAQDRVTLVGHSYGGDTAFEVVTRTARAVDILVSIDPVGITRPAWTAIRAKARLWLNVRAEPSDPAWTGDDGIAWVGGKYPRPPARGQAGAPDFAIVADAIHGAFGLMMNASTAGRSGRSLLGGNPA